MESFFPLSTDEHVNTALYATAHKDLAAAAWAVCTHLAYQSLKPGGNVPRMNQDAQKDTHPLLLGLIYSTQCALMVPV